MVSRWAWTKTIQQTKSKRDLKMVANAGNNHGFPKYVRDMAREKLKKIQLVKKRPVRRTQSYGIFGNNPFKNY